MDNVETLELLDNFLLASGSNYTSTTVPTEVKVNCLYTPVGDSILIGLQDQTLGKDVPNIRVCEWRIEAVSDEKKLLVNPYSQPDLVKKLVNKELTKDFLVKVLESVPEFAAIGIILEKYTPRDSFIPFGRANGWVIILDRNNE